MCISEGVLEDFFRNYRDEVIDVSVYDYEAEGRMRVEREEGWIDGHGKGCEEGDTRRLITQITKKVQKSKDIDTIASELEGEPETIMQK